MIPPSIEMTLQVEMYTAIVKIRKNPNEQSRIGERMIRILESALARYDEDTRPEALMTKARAVLSLCPVTQEEGERFLYTLGAILETAEKAISVR